jgi:Leucine-rich repeat (LRR) protein
LTFQSLNLSGNAIPVLSARQFSRFGLVNLQRLSLSKSGVEQVDGSAFDGLTNLIEMDLAENLLTEVSRGV